MTTYYDRAKCKNKIPIIYCGAAIEKETLFLSKGALSLLKPASTGYILPHDKLSCLSPFRHAVKMKLPYSMAGFFITGYFLERLYHRKWLMPDFLKFQRNNS